MKWTDEQKEMLKSDMSNEEIAAEVGRSVTAVQSARMYYTGHTVELARAKTLDSQKIASITSEARILDLAKKMNIRIER